MKPDSSSPSVWRSLRSGLLVIAAVVVIAYGVQVTKVDFAELSSQRRQESLTRVLRALADPDVVYYEKESQSATTTMQVPCQEGVPPPDQPQRSDGQPYVVMLDACSDQRQDTRAEGFNFTPNQEGYLRLSPAGAPSQLVGKKFTTDGAGHFTTTFRMPSIDDQTMPVTIEAIVERPFGWPKLTDNAAITGEKIVETVFIALLATLLSAIVAVPLSFLASRNIMESVVTPFVSLMAALCMAPFGAFAGGWIYGQLATLVASWATDLPASVAVLAGSLLAWGAVFYLSGLAQAGESSPSLVTRLRRQVGGLVLLVLIGLVLGATTHLVHDVGRAIEAALGPGWGFLGNFLAVMSDMLGVALPALGGVIGLALFSTTSQGVVARLLPHLGPAWARVLALLLGGLSGAVLVGLLAAGVAWLRAVDDLTFAAVPALVGGVLGAAASLFYPAGRPVNTGIIIYYVMRTFFNTLRAVEALVLAIVFVIWVGLGPFAGMLALALHNVVVFGKLYSEQVENILPGPLEAVTATGANRLQTIIYAVIPQIVAPFIALTLYRWDVNVRSSTILGFVGGGGIGFILQQNINLLKYRSASTNMLSIALVVIVLDYVSAEIRKRYV